MTELALMSFDLWLLGSLGLILLAKGIQYALEVRRARATASSGPVLIEEWLEDGGGAAGPAAGGAPAGEQTLEADPARRRMRGRSAEAPSSAILSYRPGGTPAGVAEALEDETVRIDLGASGVVQLLPGRLEVLRGAEVGREYRLLRAPGQKTSEITIGRSAGAPNRHVQIAEATVSRLHARLRYEDGSWRIANLSSTNPTRVNGEELGSLNESVPLCDGDRIELGEVEVIFRENS